MRFHTLILLLVLLAIAAFSGLNWGVLSAPTELSLGITTVRLPLGLVMLGLLVLVSALFLLYIVYLQATALLETRRQARELRANRELADQAEASRFTELRAYLAAEVNRLAQAQEQASSGLLARLEQLERDQRTLVEQAGNSLAASIGELEDRLGHAGQPPIRD